MSSLGSFDKAASWKNGCSGASALALLQLSVRIDNTRKCRFQNRCPVLTKFTRSGIDNAFKETLDGRTKTT